MSYEFNIGGQEKKPTQQEILEGFIHHTATLLNLYGAGKHLVNYYRQFEKQPLTEDAVHQVMNFNCDQIEKIKATLSRCPTITIERTKSENEEED